MNAIRRAAPEPRLVVDLVVAGVVATLAVIDVASSSSARLPGERPADVIAYALVVGGSVSLVWRRRAPFTVLAVVTAALLVFWLRDHGAYLAVLGLPALYAVAAHAERRRRAWWALGLSCVALMLVASLTLLDREDGYAALTALSMAAFLIAAIVAGVIIRNRERIFVDTERRAAEAEADRVAEAERAVARERSRIAREMHDVVAHGMSVVAVQAAAGREIVHADPDKAAEVFARIEAVGRESLTELRRMLGVLRDDGGDEPASLSPQPGLADIAAAVDARLDERRARRPGHRRPTRDPSRPASSWRPSGSCRRRSPTSASTPVRSAAATVRISYEPAVLVVEVTDDGRGAATSLAGIGTGHGLIGMRERVEIYGGELTAGPRPGGGYAVRATLPIPRRRHHPGRRPGPGIGSPVTNTGAAAP